MPMTPCLSSSRVTLRPFESERDVDYLVSLALKYKYNTLTEAEIRNDIARWGRFSWMGYAYGEEKGGCAFIQYMPSVDWNVLLAFTDADLLRKVDREGDFTYESGKLIIDFMFGGISESLFTVHSVFNRSAAKMSGRLGFLKLTEIETEHGRFSIHRLLKNQEVTDGIHS